MSESITLQTAERMLSFIPAHDRDVWVKMAYVLRDEFGDEAFDCWDRWSANSDAYKAKDSKSVWKSCKTSGGGKRAGVGSLVMLAKQHGYTKGADEHTPTAEEIEARKQARKARHAAEEAEAKREAEECAIKANQIWNNAGPATDHPYLTAKNINGYGLRVSDGEMLIPIRQKPGDLCGLQRILSDGTKLFLSGTPMSGAYFVIGTPAEKIIICEGYATGASIHEATGVCVVVAFNAGNLVHVAKKMRAALPAVDIIIAADDDWQTTGNPGITAANKAADAVFGRVAVPHWPNGEHVDGMTDFNDLHKLSGLSAVADSIYHIPESDISDHADYNPDYLDSIVDSIPVDKILVFVNNPMDCAIKFVDWLPANCRIIFWRDEFYQWVGCKYKTVEPVFLHQLIFRFLINQCQTIKFNPKSKEHENVAVVPKSKDIHEIMFALKSASASDLPEPPCWITSKHTDFPASEFIAFRNGYLHWPSRVLYKSSPRMFCITSLDFDYAPDAEYPTEWHQFLDSIFKDDTEAINTLAEIFGYMLTDDTSQQKAFMLIGPPRCGKGTILRIMEALVGKENRVSPSLASIGNQFGLQPLIGKRVAMISDARLSGKTDQQPIVENLLRITGEDAVTVDRKNKTAWSGRIQARFIMASNELPAFSDASAALANRFVMLKFSKSFLGNEDPGLTDRLLAELPGIVLWALDGLARLQKRHYFKTPESAMDQHRDMINQTSPIRCFVEETCIFDYSMTCKVDDLYKLWRKWCEDEGRHSGSKVWFGRSLGAAFPDVQKARIKLRNGVDYYNYQGIGIRSDRDYGDY